MGNKIGVLTLHGMGTHEEGYSASWQTNIRRRLAPGVSSEVAFGEVYYQEIMQKQQRALWNILRDVLGWEIKGLWPLALVIVIAISVWIAAIVVAAIRDWGLADSLALAIGLVAITAAAMWALAILSSRLWITVRRFLLYSFSDPATYAHDQDAPGSIYEKVHAEIATKLRALHDALDPDRRIVVVAHSLGAYVFSNYVWDVQEPLRRGIPADSDDLLASVDYRGIKAIARVFTAAPNIMLFVAGLEKVQPIKKPADDFEWHSFYDKDDVLGWPLHQLPPGDESSYADLVTIERPINVGNALKSWNPASHTEFLKKGTRFVKHVAEEIGNLHARINSR